MGLTGCLIGSRLINFFFYRGERIGRFGKPFKIWKFRTMCYSAETLGGFSVSETDDRVTRLGKYLRKWKIDEFPQLLNVLAGQMSLVGPRPEVKHYIDQLPEDARKTILSVKPGFTDYASIKWRNEGEVLAKADDPEAYYRDVIRPDKTKLQIQYVKDKSLWIDLKLIISTVKWLGLDFLKKA